MWWLAVFVRVASIAGAVETGAEALQKSLIGDRPTLAMFCSKANAICTDHLAAAFDEVAERNPNVNFVALSTYKDRKLAASLDVHAVPAFRFYPRNSDRPEVFSFVHYSGSYADTLETLLERRLAHQEPHDEL